MQNIDIPGPLHPDLFGVECGELPSVFRVEVCWPTGAEIECRKLTVLARSHEEAARLAHDASRANSGFAEVVDVQRLRRPTTHELKAWTQRVEVHS